MTREEDALKIAERLAEMRPIEILEKIYICKRTTPESDVVLDILVSAYRRKCEIVLQRILNGAESDE